MKKFLWISTLILLPSAFGRSPFISALKPFLKEHNALSETFFSLTYTLGTLLASFCTPLMICFLGKAFQLRKSLQYVYGIFAISLALILLLVNSQITILFCFILLMMAYFGLRLCGQGLLPALTRTYVASVCEDRQCAWIGTLHTTSLVCFGGIFLFVVSYFDFFKYWNHILTGLIVLFIIFAVKISKHLPQIQSLSTKSFKKFGLILKNFPNMFKWGILMLALHNLQATAIAFHLSDFANEQCIPLTVVFQFFLPIGLLELLFNPLIAWIYGRYRSKFLLMGILVNLIILNVSIVFLTEVIGKFMFILTCALGWSFNHILSYSLPAWTLSKEQHAIGYALLGGYVSLFSAIGPFAYSCLAALGGNYLAANNVMLLINSCILAASTWLIRRI